MWGHVVSKDMAFWEHLPAAIWTDHPFDSSGKERERERERETERQRDREEQGSDPGHLGHSSFSILTLHGPHLLYHGTAFATVFSTVVSTVSSICRLYCRPLLPLQGAWTGSTTMVPGQGPVIMFPGLTAHGVFLNLATPNDPSDPLLTVWDDV